MLSRIKWFACLTALLAQGVAAQNFPYRPIRILASEPGGGLDFTARLVAQGLTNALGQQVIVENRPSGVITGEIVARAQADGYTLLINGSSHWLLPLLKKSIPYDPIRDFAPVTLATRLPNVLVVHPSLQVTSVQSLISLAKAKPGGLNYGSSSAGTPTHIAAELFKSMAQVNIVRIPYRGAGPALNALVGGEVMVMFASASSVTPHVRSGRLRALAVTSAEPTPLAPGLPTISAAGLTGYEAGSMYGFFAPARTPKAIVTRLSEEIIRVLNRAEVKERHFNAGAEIVGSTPEQFAAVISADFSRTGKVIREAGIQAE